MTPPRTKNPDDYEQQIARMLPEFQEKELALYRMARKQRFKFAVFVNTPESKRLLLEFARAFGYTDLSLALVELMEYPFAGLRVNYEEDPIAVPRAQISLTLHLVDMQGGFSHRLRHKELIHPQIWINDLIVTLVPGFLRTRKRPGHSRSS